MHRLLLLFAIGLFIAIGAKSQKINKYIKSQESVPFQKLYLHTDREFYFTGDTLWFSAYLLEGRKHAPLAGDFNLYVELLNDEGNYVQKELFAILGGRCQGYLSFCSKDFKEGNYLLRAYTDYLKQFDEDAFFTKTIKVSNVKNTAGFETKEAKLNSENINLNFYPEGGFLLNGIINVMAFKATSKSGKEIDINGKIIDSSGKSVVNFTTSYKGMGQVYFIPDATQTYTVEIDGEQKLEYNFPEIRTTGAKLMLVSSGKKGMIINIVTHENQAAEHYYITLFHRGKSAHYFKVGGPRTIKTVHIRPKYFNNGINRLVLLNKEYEPISERLVYYNLKNDVAIEMAINATEMGTRQKVEVHFKQPENLSKNEFSRLSVSVVNKNSLNAAGVTQNIKSYLLTDSELRAYIPSPADFFVDSEEMPSYGKLNLLMLTNGWRNYIWNDINNINETKTNQQLGIAVKGTIEKYLSKKTIEHSEVTLSISDNRHGDVYTTQTNAKGEFTFNNVLFVDTAMVIVQGKNHRGTNKTTVKIKEMGVEMPERANVDLALLNSFSYIPVSMHRMQYMNELSLKEFYPDKNSRVLDEIIVKETKKEDDGHDHHRLYSEPSHSATVTSSDYHHMNFFQYLQGRFAGVVVAGNTV
ncbi:MAG: carboxypeptidase regulatory-like domain-containing protein, partial [Bizionia sp.]|nr:carboxypeptidase regulatory-like domain-containing protein [Bizionia sp.]